MEKLVALFVWNSCLGTFFGFPNVILCTLFTFFSRLKYFVFTIVNFDTKITEKEVYNKLKMRDYFSFLPMDKSKKIAFNEILTHSVYPTVAQRDGVELEVIRFVD